MVDNFKLNDYFGRADEAKKRSEKESSEFKVFIETVSEVRLKNYVSYKFLIDRGGKRKGLFEYLIQVNNNGKEAAWIIARDPDNQWIEDRYIKGKEMPFKGGISIESVSQEENLLKSRVNSCTELYYYIDERCPCEGHTVDNYCTCSTGPERTWFKSIDCSGGGGGWFFPVVVPNPPSEPIPNNVLIASDGTTPSPSVLAASLGLNSTEQTWLANNMDISNSILLYYHDSGQSSEAANFINWAIDYMEANPGVTWEHIINWFLSTPEYTGGETIINPDYITFDEPVYQVALPQLSSFTFGFPKNGTTGNYSQMPSSDVYQMVGGTLYSSHLANPSAYSNACAVRGSRGLLSSGIHIPVLNYSGSQRTQKGGDNKNYILDAVSFEKFMKTKFGETAQKLEGINANNKDHVSNLLKGKNGIYVIINNNSGAAGYSGHLDLILDGKCIGGAYTTPTGGSKINKSMGTKLVFLKVFGIFFNACDSQKIINTSQKEYLRAFKVSVFYGCVNTATNDSFNRFSQENGDLGLSKEAAVLYHAETEQALRMGQAYSKKIVSHEYADYEGKRAIISDCSKYAFYSKEVDFQAKRTYKNYQKEFRYK